MITELNYKEKCDGNREKCREAESSEVKSLR